MDTFDERRAKRLQEITDTLEALDCFSCESAEDKISVLEEELIELYHCKIGED